MKMGKRDGQRADLDDPQHDKAAELQHREPVDDLGRYASRVVRRRIKIPIHEPEAQPLEQLISLHGNNAHEEEETVEHGHGNVIQQGQHEQ